MAHKQPAAVGLFFRLFLIIAIVLGSVLLVREFDLDMPGLGSNNCADTNMYVTYKNVTLTAQSTRPYRIETAKTVTQQEFGLSDRPCYPQDGALLFMFATDDKFGIWMKNMKFNIDVLWLDSNKKVVHIEQNLTPDSYPTVYYPNNDARYVIEVNAGQASTVLKASVGTQFNW